MEDDRAVKLQDLIQRSGILCRFEKYMYYIGPFYHIYCLVFLWAGFAAQQESKGDKADAVTVFRTQYYQR